MVISLKCANCGAALEVNDTVGHLACGYCGVQQMVERKGGAVWLTVEAAIHRVQAGTDRTAAELALQRLAVEHRQVVDYLGTLRAKRAALQGSYIGPAVAWIITLGIIMLVIGGKVVGSFDDNGTAIAAVIGFVAWILASTAIGARARNGHFAAYNEHSQPILKWEEREAEIVTQIKANRKIANG